MSTFPPFQPRPTGRAQLAMTIGALGVVFGDIGTSPLYTMRECLGHLPAGMAAGDAVLGVCSLMFWSLVIVVCVKYLACVIRADNEGEGGIFALMALIHTGDAQRGLGSRRRTNALLLMILIGAALLYGDGVITPAISVLGAAEGFKQLSPDFSQTEVTWLACAILAGLFWFQHRGTRDIGRVFGPIMVVWFGALAGFGLWQVVLHPTVLQALDPREGLKLLLVSPGDVGALLGSVVLTITGAEALYADMGHFGRRPIALAWYVAAFPALIANYFGQGAYVLSHPGLTENPFFILAPPGVMRALLTGLSIVAAIIASQALISGAYSLTRQAIQLGYLPRLKISHTNAEQSGQIYLPLVNTLLAVGCIATTLQFKASDNLAAAYGIAVTGTMAITTVAFYIVTRHRWRWPPFVTAPLCGLFLFVDLAFLLANLRKVSEGGWFPLAIGAIVLAIMHTWKRGRDEIFHRVYSNNVTEAELMDIAQSSRVTRVSGAAVFMVGSPRGTPVALLHYVKSTRCLHRTVVLLSIITEEVPVIHPTERLVLSELGEGFWRAVGLYGYMETPDVSSLMEQIRARGVPVVASSTSYIFNREMIMTGGSAAMWEWQKRLYAFLSRNARPARDYYQITPTQIIEIGLPLQL